MPLLRRLEVWGSHKKKHKDEKIDGSPPKVSEEDKEEFGENAPVKAASGPVVVSGAKTSDMDAFPVDAVKSFHEKPMPTHDKGASNKPKMPIQQPRKWAICQMKAFHLFPGSIVYHTS